MSLHDKCWNCLYGHLGPGLYVMVAGFLLFLQAIGFNRWKDRYGVLLCVISIVVPVALLLETANTWPMKLANLHHTTMYFLVMLDGLFIAACRFPRGGRTRIPPVWHDVYQPLHVGIIAFMFVAHNHGNALFIGFHQVMFPGFMIGVVLQVCMTVLKHMPLFSVATGIWFCIMGSWFAHIGVAFFAHGDYGTEGSRHDQYDAMMATGTLAFYLAWHVMAWFLLLSIVYVMFESFHFIDPNVLRKRTGYHLMGNKDDDNDVIETGDEEEMARFEMSRV